MSEILNLDPTWSPNVYNSSELGLESFRFAGGEPQIRIDKPFGGEVVTIAQRFYNSEDIVKILLANDALRRMDCKNIQLFLPYFPAGRQDRVCTQGEALTLKVYADMINSCNFDRVITFAPHSDVTGALVNNVKFIDYNSVAGSAFSHFVKKDKTAIIAPDAGAAKKAYSFFESIGNDRPKDLIFVQAGKVRDPKTGALSGTSVNAESLEGYDCFVVDDVVCKGGTFKYLAQALKAKGASRLGIFTGHADCNEGITNLLLDYDFVSTTNSKGWPLKSSDSLVILPIENFINVLS